MNESLNFGPTVVVNGPDGGRAVVALHGGHVVSWQTADGRERLFLSSLATAGTEAAPAAIRGGVPVCFPQFADLGLLPKHGFARTALWRSQGGGVFTLDVSAQDWPQWPYACLLTLSVEPSQRALTLGLGIRNTGTEPFAFTGALHTYLAVDDVTAARVDGAEGCAGSDVLKGVMVQQTPISFGVEVDRQLFDLPGPLNIITGVPAAGHLPAEVVQLSQAGFTDGVVWNIGPDRAGGLADLGPGEWQRYVCVEAAQLRPTVVLPGATWAGSQRLSAR